MKSSSLQALLNSTVSVENTEIEAEEKYTPFEISPISPEAERSDEEIASYGDAIIGLMEPISELENPFEQENALVQAVAALEEIYEDLTGDIRTAEEYNLLRKSIGMHVDFSGVVEAQDEFNSMVSVEAFKAYPKASLEAANASLSHILETLWKHIQAALIAIVERLKALWVAVSKIFGWRKREIQVQKQQAQAVADTLAGKTISSKIANETIPLRGIHVSNLWLENKAHVTKDVASELHRFRTAFNAVQPACFTALDGWSKELSEELLQLVESVDGKSVDEAKAAAAAYGAKIETTMKHHKAQILSVANHYAGHYIGCVEIKNSYKPYSVYKSTRVPKEANIPLLSIQDVKALIAETERMVEDHERIAKTYYEPMLKRNEAFGSKVATIINRAKKANGTTGYAMRAVFQTYMAHFVTAFNSIGNESREVSSRITDLGRTTDYVIKYSLKRLKELGEDTNVA